DPGGQEELPGDELPPVAQFDLEGGRWPRLVAGGEAAGGDHLVVDELDAIARDLIAGRSQEVAGADPTAARVGLQLSRRRAPRAAASPPSRLRRAGRPCSKQFACPQPPGAVAPG